MAGFFSTLDRLREEAGGEAVPTFLSTHPDPADRERKVARLAEKAKRKNGATTLKVNGDNYLRMIDGIVYGEDPKQGFVENDIFYHPVLKFHFPVPSGWAYQNSPEQFQMAPKEGGAMMFLALAGGTGSLENTAQSFLQNNQLTLVESKKDNLNGMPVLMMVADQNTQQQQIRALIYLIQYGGNTYSMVGVSSAQQFNQFVNTFQRTMSNFKELTDPGKLNRQPERIRIRSVTQNGTLSQALKSFDMEDKRLNELSVLNGMHLNDQVTKGQLIKTISGGRDGGALPNAMRN
jgi:predicted Zn-dependent protease